MMVKRNDLFSMKINHTKYLPFKTNFCKKSQQYPSDKLTLLFENDYNEHIWKNSSSVEMKNKNYRGAGVAEYRFFRF